MTKIAPSILQQPHGDINLAVAHRRTSLDPTKTSLFHALVHNLDRVSPKVQATLSKRLLVFSGQNEIL